MRRLAFSLALGVSLWAAVPALAQQGTSEIGGKVTDMQGGVLPGVAIVATNEDTGVFREVVTNEDGSYFVSQMIPGRYRVSARLDGFKSLDRRGISVTVGMNTTLNLTLEVGGVAETITVTGDAPLIDVRVELTPPLSRQIGRHTASAMRMQKKLFSESFRGIRISARAFLDGAGVARGW